MAKIEKEIFLLVEQLSKLNPDIPFIYSARTRRIVANTTNINKTINVKELNFPEDGKYVFNETMSGKMQVALITEKGAEEIATLSVDKCFLTADKREQYEGYNTYSIGDGYKESLASRVFGSKEKEPRGIRYSVGAALVDPDKKESKTEEPKEESAFGDYTLVNEEPKTESKNEGSAFGGLFLDAEEKKNVEKKDEFVLIPVTKENTVDNSMDDTDERYEIDPNAKIVVPVKTEPTKAKKEKNGSIFQKSGVKKIKKNPKKFGGRIFAGRKSVEEKDLDFMDYAKAEPVKTEPVKAEPVKVEPVKVEPVKVEPVKVEPVKVEPVKTEPVKTEPKKAEPKKVEPKKDEPKKNDKPAKKGKSKFVKFLGKIKTNIKFFFLKRKKVEEKDLNFMDYVKVEPKKVEPIKKDEPKKDEPTKKDEPKKDEPTKKDEPKKDEPTKKDEPKKDEPTKKEPTEEDKRKQLVNTKYSILKSTLYNGLGEYEKAFIDDMYAEGLNVNDNEFRMMLNERCVDKGMIYRYLLEVEKLNTLRNFELLGEYERMFVEDAIAESLETVDNEFNMMLSERTVNKNQVISFMNNYKQSVKNQKEIIVAYRREVKAHQDNYSELTINELRHRVAKDKELLGDKYYICSMNKKDLTNLLEHIDEKKICKTLGL